MIENVIQLLLKGYRYIGKHPQLLMTIVLIVLIPAGFILSGQQFLSAAKDNQERLEKDRIGLLQDVFGSFLRSSHFAPEVAQNEIEHLSVLNPDITQFQIGKEVGNDVVVIAALDITSLDSKVKEPDTFRIANAHPNDSLITPYAQNGIRYWESYRLVKDDFGNEYYIYTETSLEHIDRLFADRVITAYYWLLGILIVVLILLIRHVRLIDYAYLYTETKKANEMKDLFTNMIAHELRAPLTAMRGYASMIRQNSAATDDSKAYATKIEDASGRLVLVVSDLLDIARIHAGKLTVSREKINLQKVIASVLDAIQVTAREKNIIFSQEGTKNDLYILGDEKRLFQAFTNLVSNAIKYTKSGSITVSISERSDRVEVRVKDTGMGISAENQKNIFAPFFRVENNEMNQTVGTGLGMWITKQLVELMRGSIAVESIRGVGTHVVVTLPK